MEMYGVSIPKMDLESTNLPQAWDKFQRHAELVFSGPLKNKSDEENASYVLLWVGDKGRDIRQTWTTISETDAKKPATFFKKFKEYVQPKLNPIFARFKFNNIVQGADNFESFVTKLRLAATDCQFTSSDEMIRDRIVFGISSAKLREKLINEGEKLSLDKAVQIAQNFEYAREQMRTMTTTSGEEAHSSAVYQVRRKPNERYRKYQPKRPAAAYKPRDDNKNCGNCGNKHSRTANCPAKGKQCHACKKWNHFAQMCRTNEVTKRINELRVDYESSCESDDDAFYVDTVKTAGKLVSQAHATLIIGPVKKPIKFKIDTGSMVNILPNNVYRQLKVHGPLSIASHKLTSYTGDSLKVLGTVDLPCGYKEHMVTATFYIVETNSQPLLSLTTSVDLELIKLIYAVDKSSSKHDIVTEYNDIFQGVGLLPGKCQLHLRKDAVPVVNATRRVPYAIKDKLRQELDQMEQESIICKVTEPTEWVNSLVCVEKPQTGKLRICIDPKHLNDALLRPHYPMRTLEEVTSDILGARYFSVLDAKSGYWSIELTEESSYMCTFGSPFGRYRFLRLPFGIKSSQDEFQRRMDECLEGLTGVKCIVDDILVHGKTLEEHDTNLRNVLGRCRETGIRLNPDKSKIGLTEVPYFGHILTSDGLKPDPDKVASILQMKAPTSRAELETLLGMVTYLSKFSPKLAELTNPLRALLKNDVHFHWDRQHDKAFDDVKKALTESPVLVYFDTHKPVTLQVDSSKYGLGACILQDGKPVIYASKSLTPTEVGYAQIEKEMLAILFGCKHFHHFVYGRQVLVQSDHKPIESIVKKPLSAAPARLQRMLLQLQAYDILVTHVPGKSIPVADTLSRYYAEDTCSDLIDGLDFQIHSVKSNHNMSDTKLDEVRISTDKDAELCTLKRVILDGWPDKRTHCPSSVLKYWTFRDELTVTDHMIVKGEKILIPREMRSSMLEKIHIGHLGIGKCTSRARDVMFWPGMSSDISDMVQQCDICLTHRSSNNKEPMQPHQIPEQPWQVVATDIFTLDGVDYLVTVDYYSRFFEVDKLSDTKSITVIRKLKTHFARYGICQKVVSDNAAQFTSEQFITFAREWGFEHTTSSPLYPQSNGRKDGTDG
ncbi:uncharacterized protein K02A2.6-like [Mya arenaria]|uniref:uncharacterized protein K02A2.6-like n=1 Tax=Mya arenaria TaxID=6604 RepID=UPI0022E64CAF|nr:uncharacterized protein K02A2.6-like [Mya arenaria]